MLTTLRPRWQIKSHVECSCTSMVVVVVDDLSQMKGDGCCPCPEPPRRPAVLASSRYDDAKKLVAHQVAGYLFLFSRVAAGRGSYANRKACIYTLILRRQTGGWERRCEDDGKKREKLGAVSSAGKTASQSEKRRTALWTLVLLLMDGARRALRLPQLESHFAAPLMAWPVPFPRAPLHPIGRRTVLYAQFGPFAPCTADRKSGQRALGGGP